jgi:hypothetical protein
MTSNQPEKALFAVNFTSSYSIKAQSGNNRKIGTSVIVDTENQIQSPQLSNLF